MKYFYCVATFHSTYHALQFEKVLKERGYEVKLMPVPRQVSSSCGTAGEFPCDKKEEILKICEEEGIIVDQVYKVEKKEKNNWLSKLVNFNMKI
ncbi:Protein of unknown function [Caloranaerobacter azorensis DSM 13643]|uniref:Putative Se/S carrier protein-like domain-containing protein n=1 Tax=Caloranaerobacter azorensis DSM 13643 TaxID=1121264 RepID=A0A1M5W4L1_9FIRM|nr:DUF3343 domain-containing protein [Caloranaerobacter azorensis]SHH82519.1 Protein of unknown function [Caloranaerobacter azorensis DSM 13643]